MLLASGPSDPEMQARLAAFQKQLGALGWREGDNVQIELRWFGGDAARAQRFAKEFVGLSPEVIVANGTPGIDAVRDATHNVPTVFVMVGNPVGSCYVASLAHPGRTLPDLVRSSPQ